MRYFGVNRYICTVLDEMRTCTKTQNYSYLPALIEEAQYLATAMEDALHEIKDIKHIKKEIKKLKKELKELEAKKEKLED